MDNNKPRRAGLTRYSSALQKYNDEKDEELLQLELLQLHDNIIRESKSVTVRTQSIRQSDREQYSATQELPAQQFHDNPETSLAPYTNPISLPPNQWKIFFDSLCKAHFHSEHKSEAGETTVKKRYTTFVQDPQPRNYSSRPDETYERVLNVLHDYPNSNVILYDKAFYVEFGADTFTQSLTRHTFKTRKIVWEFEYDLVDFLAKHLFLHAMAFYNNNSEIRATLFYEKSYFMRHMGRQSHIEVPKFGRRPFFGESHESILLVSSPTNYVNQFPRRNTTKGNEYGTRLKTRFSHGLRVTSLSHDLLFYMERKIAKFHWFSIDTTKETNIIMLHVQFARPLQREDINLIRDAMLFGRRVSVYEEL